MKNNIIKDDREISMKAEIYTDINNEPESIKFTNNLPIEVHEMNTETLTDMSNPTEPMMMPNEPMIEPAEAGQSIQSELTAFVENAKSTTIELFNKNQQLFITMGWILLAILGTKIVFATLGIIDNIPLITPIIKLVGLVSVVRFSWRYLVREQNRKELIEMIERTKVEVLGDRKSAS